MATTFQEVIGRAMSDPDFRSQLKADPTAACKQAGCELPAGATVEVIEEGRNELHLSLGMRTKDAAVNGVLEKAEKDLALRQSLLADPKATLEAAMADKLPAAVKVFFHAPDAKRVRLLMTPQKNNEELSDQELETVAGGVNWQRIRDVFCRDVPVTGVLKDPGQTLLTGKGQDTAIIGGTMSTKSGNIDWDAHGITT